MITSLKSKIKSQFEQLRFDEALHKYNVNDITYTSVSKNIEKFSEKVDFDAIAYSMAVKASIRLGRENEVNIIKQEILTEWKENNDEAKERGHRVHLFGELYPFNRSLKPTILDNGLPCPQEQAIVKFWEEIPPHIIPAFVELRMYHPILAFAGTSDILLFNTLDKTFIIADYKTNKDLFKNHKEKKLLAPFEHLYDCPYSKYLIQLSYYQLLFEQTGYKVSARKIIWLLKNGTYLMYDAEDLTSLLINN